MARIAHALLFALLTSCATAKPPSVTKAIAVTGVDCHMHMPASHSPPAVLNALDEAGISHGCLLSQGSHVAPGCSDRSCEGQRAFTEKQNDEAVAVARAADGRLLPFCSVPVLAVFSPDEVTRCSRLGMRGLKLHLANENVSLVQSATARGMLDALFARAARHRMPVLIHLLMEDAAEVKAFFEVARGHPTATLIAAHQIAPSLSLLPQAPPNLWIDVSGLTHAPAEAGAFFVPAWRALGIDRVLLGSDWPQLSPAAHVAMLKQYPLTEEERAKIVRSNAARLFGL